MNVWSHKSLSRSLDCVARAALREQTFTKTYPGRSSCCKFAGDLPLEGTVLVMRALVLLEGLLAIEELIAALVGAWKEHQTTRS